MSVLQRVELNRDAALRALRRLVASPRITDLERVALELVLREVSPDSSRDEAERVR